VQKKPNEPAQAPMQKASGSISRPAAPAQMQKAAPPQPRPMITAVERQQLKEQRRNAPPALTKGMPISAPPAAAANEALQAEIGRFNALQGQIMLTSVNGDVEDIESAINALPANVEHIRARGYVFKNYLEKKVETLAAQWRDLRPRVTSAVQTQAQSLQRDASGVQSTLNRGALAGAALTSLESKVGAAITNLQGMYDTLDGNVNQTQQQVDDIAWTLQQAEQASFGFLPTEAPVEAVPANWKKPDDKDGVDGVLFLTDQRLLFEQKEEVATKKVLFIATEKQKVQALQWQIAAAQVDKAVGSKKGFMGKDDYLTLTCAADGAFQNADGSTAYVPGVGGKLTTMELHLKGETGEAWQGHIGRVKSGDIAKERTVPVDAKAAEAAANAPTKCPTCGATITQTILRGQTEITCEFCGSKIRL
jgi:hypothetical protein